MPSQQEFEAEKEARIAADRRCEEMVLAMEQMRMELATWKKEEEERSENDRQLIAEIHRQLQQEANARQAAETAEETARHEAQEAVALVASLRAQANKQESEKLVGAKRALTGPAKKWLEDRSGIPSWDEMRSDMIEALGRRITASDIHDMMNKRRKKKNETILAYVQEMEFLGAQGGVSADDVRRYIINGVTNNATTRLTLLLSGTKEIFMQLLEMHDRDKAEAWDRQGQRGHLKECYQCGQKGHIARFCTEAKGFACYKCNGTGHKASDCLKKKSVRR